MSKKIDYLISSKGQEILTKANLEDPIYNNAHEVLQALAAADPTKTKKHLVFITNTFLKEIKLKDLPMMTVCLEIFETNKPLYEEKDPLRYSSFKDFFETVMSKKDVEYISKRKNKSKIKQDIEVIVDVPNFKVISLLTMAAACLYGAGTKWCVSAEKRNLFKEYTEVAPLYLIFRNNKKYLFQADTRGFKNDEDERLSKEEVDDFCCETAYIDFLEKQMNRENFLPTAKQTEKRATVNFFLRQCLDDYTLYPELLQSKFIQDNLDNLPKDIIIK